MILIQNGNIVTAHERWRGDIRCRDRRIVELGTGLVAEPGEERIDASGAYVIPGGIDPHVHLEMPFMGTVSADDWESGTAAALAGGTTTVIDFVLPARDESPLAALAHWHEKARRATCDYGFHMSLTSWSERTPEYMRRCVQEEGIPSFKIFMAYRDTIGMGDGEILRALQAARPLGALVCAHAENGDVIAELQRELIAAGKTEPRYHALSRPAVLEGEATSRLLVLAKLAGSPVYLVHMSCREAVAALEGARATGQEAHGETCAQYLVLDDSVYEKPDFEGAAYVMSPPIRPAGHADSLWAGLRAGSVELIGSDHCPFNQAGQKELGRNDFRMIPNGAAGVEDRMALLYTHGVRAGRIDLQQFVALTSTRAAELFGLYPRKGTIAVGADADLVVWDPQATKTISSRTHHQRCDRNIYEGFAVSGLPAVVISAGVVRFTAGDLRAERGAGRYLRRSARV